MNDTPLKGRVPPQNLESEQALLGALLLDWNSLGKVIHLINSESFYSRRNALIFHAILNLYNSGQQADLITLKDELTSSGKLEESGGVVYITELTNKVGTSANIEHYANIILDCAIKRELIKVSSEVIAESHDETQDSRSVLENAQKEILSITDLHQKQTIKSLHDIVGNTLQIIEKRTKNNDFTGIPSGIAGLDDLTGGFQNSELIIIGARPSMGKTALALTMMQHIAVENRIPTAFFSLEMPAMQICMRLLSQVSRVDSEKIRKGLLTDADIFKLGQSASTCYEAPLYIADSPETGILEIRSMSRRMIHEYGIKIIFIDYISLISIAAADKRLPRHEQVQAISQSLKSLARELDVPVVALSQLGREIEKTKHEPTLADIRESGSIEQDADVVLFIQRNKDKQKDANSDDKRNGLETELILAKQRNGPIGKVNVLFFPTITKFENQA
jgi:replicative DNA helicase